MKSLLSQKSSPRVKIRINPPNSAENNDVSYYSYIEEELTRIGFQVIGKDAPANIRYDLLIDVSWLRFSDPDMVTTIDFDKTKYAWSFTRAAETSDVCKYRFKKKSDADKYKKADRDKRRKIAQKAIKEDIFKDYDYSKLPELFLNSLAYSDINEGRNVISAMFKIIMSNGVVGGTIHVGYHDSYNIDSGDFGRMILKKNAYVVYKGEEFLFGIGNVQKPMSYIPFAELYHPYSEVKNRLETILKWIYACIPSANPYAQQLTAGQDVKISDEQIVENSSSKSKTSGGSSGYGRTYYHRYYNSSYYSGGYGSSTSSNSSSTTTKVDAQWMRCSDFYGYYRPLAKKFANELQKLIQ